MGMRARYFLAAHLEPALHHLDLVGLRDLDPLCQFAHVITARPVRNERRHVECLRVVMNHPLHELHVRGGVTHLRQIGGLFGRHDATRRARRARLDDRGR
jgi:hypothetical protein